MNCPSQLITLYREGRVIPFIGAGASMGVEWESNGESKQGFSWSELVDQAARMMGFEDPELLRVRGSDLQILEYFRLTNGNFQPLINWMVSEMRPSDKDLMNSSLHQALSSLEKCSLYYTTNFDDFLERSLNLLGRSTSTVVGERHMKSALGNVEVVKFHGDFNNPEKMVLSESDYEKRVKLETDLDYRLRSDVLGKAILFVGYSFRDLNISYLFRLVNDTFGPLPASDSGKRAYIISFNPSDFEVRLFADRNIEVIPVSGSESSSAVSSIIAQMRR